MIIRLCNNNNPSSYLDIVVHVRDTEIILLHKVQVLADLVDQVAALGFFLQRREEEEEKKTLLLKLPKWNNELMTNTQ